MPWEAAAREAVASRAIGRTLYYQAFKMADTGAVTIRTRKFVSEQRAYTMAGETGWRQSRERGIGHGAYGVDMVSLDRRRQHMQGHQSEEVLVSLGEAGMKGSKAGPP